MSDEPAYDEEIDRFGITESIEFESAQPEQDSSDLFAVQNVRKDFPETWIWFYDEKYELRIIFKNRFY